MRIRGQTSSMERSSTTQKGTLHPCSCTPYHQSSSAPNFQSCIPVTVPQRLNDSTFQEFGAGSYREVFKLRHLHQDYLTGTVEWPSYGVYSSTVTSLEMHKSIQKSSFVIIHNPPFSQPDHVVNLIQKSSCPPGLVSIEFYTTVDA